MKLTPLKIRGKKGASMQVQQPQNTNNHPAKRSLSQATDSARERKRHRPKPRRAGTALIEQLPLEILERIFFLSENLNFPRSSPHLGCLLSSRLTLLGLVVTAFAPTWDVWFGCLPGKVQSYRCWEWDHRRFGGDPEFQSRVLACRRVDVSVLLDAQKLWLRRQSGGPRFLEMLPFPLKGFLDPSEPPVRSDVPATSEDIERCFEWGWQCHVAWCEAMVRSISSLPALMGDDGDEDSSAVRHQFGLGVYQRTDVLGVHELLSSLAAEHLDRIPTIAWPLFRYNTPTSLDMNPGAKIPDELITGPLDWAKAKLLFWFVRQGVQLDDRWTWELTKLGHERLMELDDPKLRLVGMGLFCRLHAFVYWPDPNGFMRRQAAVKINSSPTPDERGLWAILYHALRERCDPIRGSPWDNDKFISF